MICPFKMWLFIVSISIREHKKHFDGLSPPWHKTPPHHHHHPEVELCAYLTSLPIRKQLTCRKRILLDRRTVRTLKKVSTLTMTAEDSVVIEDFAFSDQRNFFRIPPYCRLLLSVTETGETVYATDRDVRIKLGIYQTAKYYHFMVM